MSRSITFAMVALVLGASATGAFAKGPKSLDEFVECAAGETIANSLGAGNTAITVSGSCTKNVEITVDGVTLSGDPLSFGSVAPADPAAPTIAIRGASGVRIENLTIDATAGTAGVLARNSEAALNEVTVTTATTGSFANLGVAALEGASIALTDCTVTGGDIGILANNGGYVSATDCVIENAANVDLMANRNGSAELRTGIGGGNLIQNNADGLQAVEGGVIRARAGTQIKNNTNDGARGIRGGVLTIETADITDNGGDGVDMFGHSTVRISGGSVSDNGGIGVKLNASSGDLSNVTVDGNAGRGVFALDASSVTMAGGSASSNGNRGVYALGSSAFALTGVTVSDNANRGIVASSGSSGRIAGSTVTGNNDRGVWAWDNSTIELTGGNTVTGNAIQKRGVRAQNNSSIQIYDDNTVTGHSNGDLTAYEGSFVEVESLNGAPPLESTIGTVNVSGESRLSMYSGTATSVVIGIGSTGRFYGDEAGSPATVSGNVQCWTSGASAAFASDAIAEASGVPTDGLTLGGATDCATLISQGFPSL